MLKHVILQHQARTIVSANEEDTQRIHVRRSHLLADALRQFSKSSFDVDKMLQVRFVAEEAVDEGGPRREFFHLLLNEVFRSSLFSGFPENVLPRHNVKAVSENKFYYIGKMIATCIVQGGEVPACFSRSCADYIVYGRVRSPVCLKDIPDEEVRRSLQKVSC